MSSKLAVIVGVSVVLAIGCTDVQEPAVPSPAEELSTVYPVQERAPYDRPADAPTRWDAPWWTMSDEELADSIDAAGGRVFVGFKEPTARAGVDDWGRVLASKTDAAAGKALLQSLGLTIEEEAKLTPTVVTTIPRSLVAELRADPRVDYVEPIVMGTYAQQDTTWNVWRVRAPEAWTSSTGSGVKVLIIDTGVPSNHPDLNPAVIQACDGSNGLDQDGHGTHVSGIVAAVDNAQYVIGVGHGVQLWSSKVGTYAPTAQYVRCAIEFGRINGVFAFNMSFVFVSPNTAVTDQITAAYGEGRFLAAAAGNDVGGPVRYPASLSEVVAVTATDINNAHWGGANVGPEVELAAPGVNVISTSLPSGGTCTTGGWTASCTGTSMATPHVTAAAAILKAFNPNWSNTVIRQRLHDGAVDLGVPGHDTFYGYGLLDIRGALDYQPPPTLTVQIIGPTSMRPETECYYYSTVGGGTPPYSYQWYQGGRQIGTQSWAEVSSSGYVSSFLLHLSVHDSQGIIGSRDTTVTINVHAPICIQ